MLFTPSQRRGKITQVDSPMLDSESEADTDVSSQYSISDSESEADTDVSDQYSIPDSVEPTTTGECQFVPPAANNI